MSGHAYRERLRSADDAAQLVRDRDEIYLPLAPAQPTALLAALGRRERFSELRILCALLQERFAVLERPGVRVVSQFFGHVERDLVKDGVAIDHLTSDFHGLELIARRTKPRVVATTLAPPDEDGFLSFGVHAGALIVPFLEAARDPERLAIAEVNARMPRTRGLPELGGHRVHVSQVDVLVEHDAELFELSGKFRGDADARIAAHASELIADGATLQFGIGGIPNAIARILADGPRGGFGIHTEMLVDGVKLLHDAGKVENRKGVHDGFSVCTFALGSRALYDWAEHEPALRFLPVSATNLPAVIGRNRRMLSVNAAIMIDLSGQVVADTVAGRQHSGVGGHESFVTGAREADGGTSILCLHATATVHGERRTRIVAELPPGSIVTTPRHQVQWVATEHGIANLFGLSQRERTECLIALADPDHREELRAAARARVHVGPA
ncbi:4-hydroxybutyrate CoA-transferase [Candidatus Binatia bacterium]|nr:4-hydroxybutyrate CoA-transferase [Candidatus Binatia bacterium]